MPSVKMTRSSLASACSHNAQGDPNPVVTQVFIYLYLAARLLHFLIFGCIGLTHFGLGRVQDEDVTAHQTAGVACLGEARVLMKPLPHNSELNDPRIYIFAIRRLALWSFAKRISSKSHLNASHAVGFALLSALDGD